MRLHDTTDDPLVKQFTCDFPNCDKEFRYLGNLKFYNKREKKNSICFSFSRPIKASRL